MTPHPLTRALVGLLAGLLAAVLLAGCGGTGDTEEAADPAATTSGAGESSSGPAEPEKSEKPEKSGKPDAAPVPETLDFTATTVEGRSFEGASLAGRPTLLWFWAPWCPTCRGQIPQVEGLASTHGEDLQVIGVGALDSAEAIADFADDVTGVTHLEDVDGELFRRFGITEQSSFVLLDADGGVAFETGYGGADELDQRVGDVVG